MLNLPPPRAGTDGDEPRLNDPVGQAVGRGLKDFFYHTNPVYQ